MAVRDLALSRGTSQLRSQEEYNRIFLENVKPWRDMAKEMGCDMDAFDMHIAIKKGYSDAYLEDARSYYKTRNKEI